MIFKSVHFPNEVVATRRGSPLLIGVKTPKKLKVDFVDVEFGGIAEERERKDSAYCCFMLCICGRVFWNAL